MNGSANNFPNKLGNNADSYLASTELAVFKAILGRLPTVKEYLEK